MIPTDCGGTGDWATDPTPLQKLSGSDVETRTQGPTPEPAHPNRPITPGPGIPDPSDDCGPHTQQYMAHSQPAHGSLSEQWPPP